MSAQTLASSDSTASAPGVPLTGVRTSAVRDAAAYCALLAASVQVIGGLLLSIGVAGECIGRIYLEAKARPRYIVVSFIDSDNGFVTPEGPCGARPAPAPRRDRMPRAGFSPHGEARRVHAYDWVD